MKKQISEKDTKTLTDFLKDRVSRYHVEINRGDIDSAAHQMIDYYLSLMLPCVSHVKENLKQKMLYCLWNLILDDCIDYGGDSSSFLGDTLKILSYLPMEKKVNPKTPAGYVMNELIEINLSFTNCNSPMGRAFLFLDAIDHVKAFTFEQLAYKRDDLVSMFEYEEHSAITHDPRLCLDIDICTTEESIFSPNMIKKLRQAYRLLGLAFKLQGDIVTFEREFFKENSLNSVIILGLEDSVLPSNVLNLESSGKNEIFKNIVPHLFDTIRKRSLHYRDKALEKLREVEDIDISSLEKAIIYFTEEKFPGTEIEKNI